MDTQNSGQELKVWRERLGKDEAWIEEILDNTHVAGWSVGRGSVAQNGRTRRHICEGANYSPYPYSNADIKLYRDAYRAALEAEEARQAAERGPVEPVCPEGVRVLSWEMRPGSTLVEGVGLVLADGSVEVCGATRKPEHLRYLADLADYRAATHAASDRQRKLDAVRAAEEAWDAARKAHNETSKRICEAHEALNAARREAGL